jgi:hypothetical protein
VCDGVAEPAVMMVAGVLVGPGLDRRGLLEHPGRDPARKEGRAIDAQHDVQRPEGRRRRVQHGDDATLRRDRDAERPLGEHHVMRA